MIMNMQKPCEFKVIRISRHGFMLQFIAKDECFYLVQGIYILKHAIF